MSQSKPGSKLLISEEVHEFKMDYWIDFKMSGVIYLFNRFCWQTLIKLQFFKIQIDGLTSYDLRALRLNHIGSNILIYAIYPLLTHINVIDNIE